MVGYKVNRGFIRSFVGAILSRGQSCINGKNKSKEHLHTPLIAEK